MTGKPGDVISGKVNFFGMLSTGSIGNAAHGADVEIERLNLGACPERRRGVEVSADGLNRGCENSREGRGVGKDPG